MNENNKGEIKPVETIPPVVEKKEEPSQSVVRKELDKVKVPRSKSAQIRYNITRMQDELAEIEKEEGVTVGELDEDKDKPVTVGMLAEREKSQAQKTALKMAEDIADEDERELTKHYIRNRIIPSGNPQEDLRIAQSLVNSLKNQQIVEEIHRGGARPSSGSGSGGPAKPPEDQFIPTEAEMGMMRAPFNLTKEDIIKSRNASNK